MTYGHLLVRNPYVSIRPERRERAFPLAFLSSTLVGVSSALVEMIGLDKTGRDCGLLDSSLVVCSHFICNMAPALPSRRRGFQFRAEEIEDLLDIIESLLPISAENWQAVADSHLENYRREARTAESLRRKFQEISRRTGPTGDPNCPPYVIRAKRINRQLIQMIDASSGGSEAGRSDDDLSNASDSGDEGGDEGAGEFAVINDAAAIGGEEGIADDDAADDGEVARPPDGDAPTDGVAPARSVARPSGRPAARAVERNGSDGQMSVSSGTAGASRRDLRGRAFRTPINRGRKRDRTDDDDDGGFSVSNMMGMMMQQQWSEQRSREDDRMAREAELTLRREELAMRREEMTAQLQIQREESRAQQQMMNVMLMAMMQNIAGTNQHQRRTDSGEIGGNNQQEHNDETNNN